MGRSRLVICWTISPTLSQAMKADALVKALGSVIGKALRPLNEGQCCESADKN